jgi:hypothetical protein
VSRLRPHRLSAGHPDANQGEVVAAFRRCGALVEALSALGGGIPDLLVGIQGRWLLVEVKDGSRPPSGRRLRPSQAAFHRIAQAAGLPVHIVESPQQAVELFNREVRRG